MIDLRLANCYGTDFWICRMKLVIFNFITLVFLTSCAVIKDSGRSNITRLDKHNVQSLNAVYLNTPLDSVTNSDPIFNSLWFQISGFRYDRKRQPSWRSQTVKFESISDKRLKASLFLGDSLIKQKTMKGKLKEGYFYRRPSFIVIPLFPLLCGYETTRYRFGLTEDKLIVDYKTHFWLFALLAGNSGNYQKTETYEKKN